MPDYTAIKNHCNKISRLTESVIDEFLLYHAVAHDRLEPKMNKHFDKYRHLTRQYPKEAINRFKAQYIVHKIFRKSGLIKKYLNHSELKALSGSEMEYLRHFAGIPWKFSFSVITGQPATDFFEMADIFTGEEFLLFSPGISSILKNQGVRLWFNLIADNGQCWQTYGPILAFSSFQPGDIFFFASEIKPIETDEDVIKVVDRNPVPFMLLSCGTTKPVVVTRGHQAVHCMSELDIEIFDPQELKNHFRVEFAKDVFRLTMKNWGEFPHYAILYYEEASRILVASSMTDKGYDVLIKLLRRYGYKFPKLPDIRVNPSMISTANIILKKSIHLNPYDHLFEVKKSKTEQAGLDNLNKMLNDIMPQINAGIRPDVDKLAKLYDVDVKTVSDIVDHMMKLTGKT